MNDFFNDFFRYLMNHFTADDFLKYFQVLSLSIASVMIVVFIVFVTLKRYYVMSILPRAYAKEMARLKKLQIAQAPPETDVMPHISSRNYPTAADGRAIKLLWSHLNNGQKRELLWDYQFEVYTSRGVFRIGVNGMVDYRTPKGDFRYACIQPRGFPSLPLADHILALKILAESNPTLFLKTAVIR